MADTYNPQNANQLASLTEIDNTKSFIVVDKTDNKGYLLDYNKLADAVFGKLFSNKMEEDSLKFYFIEDD